ncbi:CTD phosphatase [Naegleria gruberi]|uniref:CTD phosphatase n=1 Tax=Naegleria gruberi TaxID=5762 RepID=D2UY35_NAEGR|nr:CTD phosphatase [Naegleria gruberi]EFC50404.1 CTD phosphatase [Naegleria gruberi]|eukprot:XP_002683148.1 CTD phosphatase [Naegleria gruberi strain NEG-M]
MNNSASSSPMINSQEIQSSQEEENRTPLIKLNVKPIPKLFTVLNYPIIIIMSIMNVFYSLFVNSWNFLHSLFSPPQSKKKKQRKSKEYDNSTQNSSTSSNSSSSSLPPLGFLSVLSGRTSRSNSNAEKPTQQSKKFLILDLDETLIHASTTPPRADHERLYNYILDVQIDHVNCTFYVSERPHLKLFMEKVCEWYNVVIFTASVKNYANPVIDRLYHSDKIVKRLFRSSCYVTEHGVYVKDLKTVTDDLSKCMIIDNSPISYMWYQENAIPISNWMGDNERDRALLNLLPFLEAMRHLEDVKSILSFRIGL